MTRKEGRKAMREEDNIEMKEVKAKGSSLQNTS